ncbi:SDR family NAD(P)-dependent oxidoreductase [Halostagnicola sp. A-GB9-2]|uniref:SDR family NAD(P)-dependent oxidoreductase n=1 Tax=Halostagnicola sp. A-GB9-2 TaxID=3048066 RepID=UPI0024C07BB9|nr:SDR family NAD(P)-dependent oxidoreductase [Halostagnicola sp. A-GB9-2]MDJ1433833.1 SDR family NAD(P)-dependent oxidoreductase [Halostagnicola sp. A-GB9-2]
MRFANSVAIVTGGSTGIGRAIATKLADDGATIVVADITEKTRLEREVGTTAEAIREAGGKARYQEADVSDEADVRDLIEATVDEFGRLDILVNNAGTAARTSATETTLKDWQTVLDVNLTGTFLCSKHALSHLEESPNGRIVNISSERGLSGGQDRPAYSASKGGVSNLTRQLAVDYSDRGVTVNAVCPGPIDTARLESMVEDGVDEFLDTVATPYLGEPEDVANAVAFLASEEARYITGHNLLVDGGHHQL